ncbi:hypothetical protein DFH27DRAFT_632956 [Peziza echinospora]|nr:hypothetical protein DFH27DRAFT_632956 [Peziza echinospora]
MLPAVAVQLMTEAYGCFDRFRARMQENWARQLPMRQKLEDERRRPVDKTCQEYYYLKPKLQSSVYHESEDVTPLSHIHGSFNDLKISLNIRERHRFLNLEMTTIHNELWSTRRNQLSLRQRGQQYRVPESHHLLKDSSQRVRKQNNFSSAWSVCEFSLTGSVKYARNVVDEYGMHISFECPLKSPIQSLAVKLSDSEDDERDSPGLLHTSHGDHPRSYTLTAEVGTGWGDL